VARGRESFEKVFQLWFRSVDVSQITQHKAPVSILVACAQDAGIFPSGLEMLSRLSRYPYQEAFEAHELPRMRATFEALLGNEAAETKEQLYMVSLDLRFYFDRLSSFLAELD
jgi:hypothetical protein